MISIIWSYTIIWQVKSRWFWLAFYQYIFFTYFRELDAKASAAARQIKGSGTNNLAIELKNGKEEEAALSAVQRSGSNNQGTLNKFFKISKPISQFVWLFTSFVRVSTLKLFQKSKQKVTQECKIYVLQKLNRSLFEGISMWSLITKSFLSRIWYQVFGTHVG